MRSLVPHSSYKGGSELVWSGLRKTFCFDYEPPTTGELESSVFIPRFGIQTSRRRLIAVSGGGMPGAKTSTGP